MKREDCIDRNSFLEVCNNYCEANCPYLKVQRKFMCKACMMGDAIMFAEDEPSVYPKSDKVLEDIKAELNAYGSLWVSYTINGHTDSDIQKLVEDVLKQAKEQVLDVIDRHISGEEQ